MKVKQYVLLILLFISSTLLGVSYFNNFSIKSDILSSLDQEIYSVEASKAYSEYEKNLSSQIMIMLISDNFELLKKEMSPVVEQLKKSNLFKDISARRTNEENQNLSRFYFQHKRKILTTEQVSLIESDQLNIIEKRAIRKLYSPFSSAAAMFQNDPYLLMDDFFSRLNINSKIELADGYLIGSFKEKKSILIRAKLRDSKKAQSALDFLTNLKNNKYDLVFSSLAFYGAKAKIQAIEESNKYSFLSIILILIFFYRFFRSVRHVLISLAVIGLSSMIGLYITTLVFGQIHIVSLLLGISILGIIADYFIHFFMEERDSDISNAKSAIDKIKIPMFYSFLTSGFGFLVFLFVPLSIIHQFSLFAVITLIMALIMVSFVLPYFFYSTPQVNSTSLNERIQTKLKSNNIVKVFTFLLIVISLVSMIDKKVDNDVRTFSVRDKELFSDEQKIRRFLGVNYNFEQFLVMGDSEQELLEREEELKIKLLNRKVNASFFSNWIPSIKNQKLSQTSYEKLDQNLTKYLKSIKVKNIKTIKENLSLQDSKTIQPQDILNSEIKSQWLGEVGEKYYSVVPILRSEYKNNLASLNTDSFIYVNKIETINTSLNKISKNILVGLFSFFAICYILFSIKFGLIRARNLLKPTFISIVVTLAISSFVLGGISIFQLLACVLIVALGLDYSFFYFFNRSKSKSVSYAVTLSTLTTLSSFGVLFFSGTKAVSVFGGVVLVGMILCWLLVPTVAIGDLDE